MLKFFQISLVFNFIKNIQEMFEQEPMERLLNLTQVKAYKHYDFWQCMDTKRDVDLLERMFNAKENIWSERFSKYKITKGNN